MIWEIYKYVILVPYSGVNWAEILKTSLSWHLYLVGLLIRIPSLNEHKMYKKNKKKNTEFYLKKQTRNKRNVCALVFLDAAVHTGEKVQLFISQQFFSP